MFGLNTPHHYLPGMNHGSRSPSLGMISTATRTTATVSPLSPLTNGNAVAQSANSGFAAALRKLAKQAEDPRGCSISIESSPVSSPATSLSSPGTTPQKGSSGPKLPGLSRGQGRPRTPPVVPIAPIKSTNSLWRAEGGQVESLCGRSSQVQQDKRRSPLLSPHPLIHPFSLTPSTVIHDPRMQSHSLPGQMHPVVPSGAVPEEYLRGLRPFSTPEDLRLSSLPLGLDPATAAQAAAAYYHPAYLHHPLALHRMEESLCLSALRSQFYSVPAGGSFPSLHHSGLHLHLPGARYPGELNHTALADRLQMENELRQREREQERERLNNRERKREREEEKERDLEMQKERQRERQRERQQQMARAVESHYLAELQARRQPPEGRVMPGERLTPSQQDIVKDQNHASLPKQKPLSRQHGLQSTLGSIPYPVPSLVPSYMGKHQAATATGLHGQLAAAMRSQRAGEEGWISQQRRKERQDRELPSELCISLPGKGAEPRRDMHRVNSVQQHSNREANPHLGGPPPLISPKTTSAHPPHPHQPPCQAHPSTSLWNPATLVNTPMDCHHKALPGPPSRPPPGLTRADRASSHTERPEDGERSRTEVPERYTAPAGGRGTKEHPAFWSNGNHHRASSQNLPHQHHHNPHAHMLLQGSPKTLSAGPIPSSSSELRGLSSGTREGPGLPAAPRSILVYDEVLQQHRLLLSKLDLEEKRRKEAREGGFFYDMEESYDESDEEDVKAHLKRVTQQPPLKLDASSEKVEFLGVLGLTTLRRRNDILERKRRKWRRMMKERSPSPPAATQGKKKSCPPPLTTPYTAQQMDSSPMLEEKKGFLQMFSLAHVTPQQRRDKEHTEGLLRAIQNKTVTLDTLRYNPLPTCSSPPPIGDSSTQVRPQGRSKRQDSPGSSPQRTHPIKNHCVEPFNPYPDTQIPRSIHPQPTLLHAGEKTTFKNTIQTTKKQLQTQGLLNSQPSSAPHKEPSPGLQNGRSRPWKKVTPEDFVQQFHHSVLQSTQNTLQTNGVPEANMKSSPSLPLNMSSAMKGPRVHSAVPQPAYHNGHHSQYPGACDAPGPQGRLSAEEEEQEQGESGQDEEEEEEEEEEGEMEVAEAPRRWSGIEAIFEAYQEYTEEWSVECQVLHGQCKRLEAQNHTLSRTAEQMSVTMGELVGQRQKVREERERLQAQLEHFRRCLTLPSIYWGRGQVNSHGTPR